MSVVQIEEVAIFLEQHRPALLAYLGRAFEVNAADREDIVQEVCVRAYRSIAGGQAIGQQTFLPWLYRMTHNAAIDCWRHRTRLDLVPLAETWGYLQVTFEERIIEHHEITAILAQLPLALAECLVFSSVYGYSVKEIAQRQQVKDNLVRVRIMRARRQFASIYCRQVEPG